jgi:hypothetical protein
MASARIDSARETRGMTEGAWLSAFSVAINFRENTMPMMARAIHKIGIVEVASAAIENPRVTNLLGDARIVVQRSREWEVVVAMESAKCTTIKEW